MSRPKVASLLLLACGLAGGVWLAPDLSSDPKPTPEDLMALSESIADLGERVHNATVHVRVTARGNEESAPFGLDEGLSEGFGTGFVVDSRAGIVVTNAHVVQNSEAGVTVSLLDGRRTPASVLGVDARTDVAVVRIPGGFARSELTWGDSDALRAGSLVLAVGSPLGLEGTTSLGVLSGKNRKVHRGRSEQFFLQDYLQFDAFIDRGSSGGPLVDMKGNVVGVNTAISGRQWRGISYAVPEDVARHVVNEIVEFGEVRRGWLGVNLQEVGANEAETYSLARPFGALVTKVVPNTPAAKGGLKKHDIIIAYNDVEVANMEALRTKITATAPGQTVKLRIWRDGAPMIRRVTLSLLENEVE